MDLRLLQFVVVVAEERHFGRAAERVHLTQSGLSQAVQRLERELGFEIFHRSSRSVELTGAGQVFLDDATALLAAADQMVERARAVSEGRIGELHVGYSPSIRVTAARVLADFTRRRPGLEITHRQEYTYPLITAVHSGSLDAAIIISQDLSDDFVAEPFADLPLVCLAPRTHALAGREHATLAEIAAHEVAAVDGPRLGFWRRFLAELFASEDLAPTFVPESDPVGGELPMPQRGPLWLVPAELSTHPADQIVLKPPRDVSFALIWRRGTETPGLNRLRRHVAATRDDKPAATPHGHPRPPSAQTAVKSAGSRSQGRRAPAPARSGRG